MAVGRYRTIVADPPWPMKDTGPRTHAGTGRWRSVDAGRKTVIPYETMTLGEIAALPVEGLADDDGAHLYLWTTNRFIEAAYATVRAWGFRPSTLLTWCKPPMGLGFGGAYATTTEHVVFAHAGGGSRRSTAGTRRGLRQGGPTRTARLRTRRSRTRSWISWSKCRPARTWSCSRVAPGSGGTIGATKAWAPRRWGRPRAERR